MDDVKTIENCYQEMDIKIEILEEQWESTYEKWQMQLIPSVEMELLNNIISVISSLHC